MLLPVEQFCGSRLNYKLFHALLRVTCSLSIVLVLIIFFTSRLSNALLGNPFVGDFAFQWFLYYSPVAVLSLCVFGSFWLGRTELESRALAIDWFFVLGYLFVWGFGVVKGFLSMPIF